MHAIKRLLRGRLSAVVFLAILVAWATTVRAGSSAQFNDPVKQGEYLAIVAGCRECHSPPVSAADNRPDPNRLFVGGRAFPLGPLGVLISRNLTPDPETGLGTWSDEEIKTAIRTGQAKGGIMLFPLMPFHLFSNMAESDLDAIVAYLRTLPAVKNEIPRQQLLPEGAVQPIPLKQGIVAPPPSDTAARGKYLMTSVLPCTDCHTPIDAATGQPEMANYLAGGQPFEGPWGIIYGGNITPDPDTGLGKWTDEEIKRVIKEGIRPDGRQVVIMPSPEYQHFTDEDLNAIVHYLRNDVQPVNREVPAPNLKPEFVQHVETSTGVSPMLVGAIAVGVVVLLGVLGFLWLGRRRARVQ